ncbi:hypothetical protein D3C84_1256020 [compost metagenome]
MSVTEDTCTTHTSHYNAFQPYNPVPLCLVFDLFVIEDLIVASGVLFLAEPGVLDPVNDFFDR